MSKEKLIPELRFPEFENDGSWENVSLEDVADIIKGKQLNRLQLSESGTYPCLNGGISPSGYTDKFNTKANTITISEGGNSCGFVSYMTTKFWLGGHCYKIDLKKSTSLEFFYQLLKANELRIKRLRVGSGLPNIQKGTLLSLRMPFVSNPDEQQKIASCLSSLDELLAAHNDKLDALKDHKKGLLQNLFPQEGETVPRVRFPEFEGDGEWEKIELGDLVTIKGRIGYRGYTKDDIVAKGEGAISMSPSNINDQGTLSFEKSTYITWDKYYESPEIMLEDGFTVLVKTGSTFGKVAFISNLNEKTTINPQLVVLKPNGIDKYFLYLIVSNTSVQKQITATVVGGAIPTLSQDSISKFEVMVPRHDEQQKISSCLSALDELITAQQEKIAQLQQHKKGLMQGLFPKIES